METENITENVQGAETEKRIGIKLSYLKELREKPKLLEELIKAAEKYPDAKFPFLKMIADGEYRQLKIKI